VDVKNKITLGDELELLTANGNYRFALNNLMDYSGNNIECAPGSGHQVWVDIEQNIDEVNLGLLCRIQSEEEARINLE
jgi:putative protease